MAGQRPKVTIDLETGGPQGIKVTRVLRWQWLTTTTGTRKEGGPESTTKIKTSQFDHTVRQVARPHMCVGESDEVMVEAPPSDWINKRQQITEKNSDESSSFVDYLIFGWAAAAIWFNLNNQHNTHTHTHRMRIWFVSLLSECSPTQFAADWRLEETHCRGGAGKGGKGGARSGRGWWLWWAASGMKLFFFFF